MAVKEVAGRRFATQADYEAALRDLRKIEDIKKKTDLMKPDQVMQIYSKIESGEIHFETLVGTDFDDELYELVQKLKNKSGTTKDKKTKEVSKSTTHLSDDELQKAALKQIQKKRIRRNIVSIIIALIAMSSLWYFAIYSRNLSNNIKNNQSLIILKKKAPVVEPVVHLTTEEDKELFLLDEYKNLYIRNKSIIGWLKIDDTIIDYPVMQTNNNDYFLNHNFEGNEDKNGSLFLDKDCSVVNRNTNLIIYGHHMKSGKMFGTLNKYSEMSYYEKHPYIQFDSIYEKGLYQVMYVFRDKVYSEQEITFKYYQFIDANSADEFRSNMQEMAKMSLYYTGVEASYGDQLLTLSTCDHTETDGRFVVVAKRIE